MRSSGVGQPADFLLPSGPVLSVMTKPITNKPAPGNLDLHREVVSCTLSVPLVVAVMPLDRVGAVGAGQVSKQPIQLCGAMSVGLPVRPIDVAVDGLEDEVLRAELLGDLPPKRLVGHDGDDGVAAAVGDALEQTAALAELRLLRHEVGLSHQSTHGGVYSGRIIPEDGIEGVGRDRQ